jgi:hypothetical protein
MRTTELYESAAKELARKLPSLEKHDYNTIDKLMRRIASKHSITGKALHDLFVKKFHRSPDSWIKNKLDEGDNSELQQEVDKFCDWACQRLHLKNKPTIELSMDTDEAQNNHHTGGHKMGDDSIWVYAKNRNLVDILRTVFHELVHVLFTPATVRLELLLNKLSCNEKVNFKLAKKNMAAYEEYLVNHITKVIIKQEGDN